MTTNFFNIYVDRYNSYNINITICYILRRTIKEKIIEYCSKNIARYKIPGQIFFIDSLPYNPGGKVMKYLLKEQYNDHAKNNRS